MDEEEGGRRCLRLITACCFLSQHHHLHPLLSKTSIYLWKPCDRMPIELSISERSHIRIMLQLFSSLIVCCSIYLPYPYDRLNEVSCLSFRSDYNKSPNAPLLLNISNFGILGALFYAYSSKLSNGKWGGLTSVYHSFLMTPRVSSECLTWELLKKRILTPLLSSFPPSEYC